MNGALAILNVGDGDTKLSFDKEKPEERERAARIVGEMLRQGFAILVEVEVGDEKLYRRATAFDPETCEYIIAGIPGAYEAVTLAAESAAPSGDAPLIKKRRGPKPGTRRVPAAKTRATGVARSAGGCHRDTRYVRGSR